MKAIVCHAHGALETLRWEDTDSPTLGAGQARIDVHAAGVNFADTLKVQGTHQVKVTLPWTPGAEIAGFVKEVAEGVSGLRVGDRVLGVPGDRAGGFAEEIVLGAERVLSLPASLPFEQAAALPAAYGTALYSLKQRAHLCAGEVILVLGAAGGVGQAAVQIAAAMGARVIAGASTAEKRQAALQHGASHAVDYTQENWRTQILELTGPSGVDVVFDPVGGDVFDEAVRTVGWDGRYLVVGFAAGRIPALKLNHPLVKGYNVMGIRYDVWRDRFWPEARANLEQVLTWHTEGKVRPLVSRTGAVSNAVEALLAIAGREVMGKVVLTAGSASSDFNTEPQGMPL